MNHKKAGYIIQAIIGAGLVTAGLFVFHAEGMWAQFGICVGFGAAFLALGISRLLYTLRLSHEEQRRIEEQKEIEVNDERNVRIREKAGSMAAKIMTYVLCAFLLVLVLMNADKWIVLAAAGLLAVKLILMITLTNYYFKKL